MYRPLGLCLAALVATPAAATDIRFTLDWRYQGIHAFVFWAEAQGYFADEGLNVTIDQGEGSAATVTRILSGVYDAGLGDVNAIVQTAAAGEAAPVMTYMYYNSAPFALISLADGGIDTLDGIAGQRVGTPAGATAGLLLPALAALNDIDASGIEFINMAPNLQEQMLLGGQVDVSAVFSVTSYANMLGLGLDPDADLNWFMYADHGMPLYSNGLMVSRQLLADNPEAVAGLTRALNRALIEVAQDPVAGMQPLVAAEPLVDADLEALRFDFALRNHILTDESLEIGLGAIDPDRMAAAIDMLVELYDLPRTPGVDEIFDASFLPPLEERQLTLP